MEENLKLFKSRFPRDLLNEIKWKSYDLSKVQIYYKNRGSPNDVNIINGKSILKIDKAFLIINGIPFEVSIPYHRFIKITYDGEEIFNR
jgi:uncharacterized protein (UPF0248 family)